jgi:thiamine biosynthesis lipoprotein
MQADAWATALTVMGADDGMAFARTHALAARFVSRGTHGIEEHMSPAFEQLLADDRVDAA